jgi:hypothetical protein
MAADELLTRLRSAPSAEEALAVLDQLAGVEPAVPVLGDLYEDVAERLAGDDAFAAAADAQRKAIEHGLEPDGRELLAWYLLKAGEREQAGALWDELLAERPDDADLRLTAGVAHLDAGLAADAAALLGAALEHALAASLDATVLREAAAERRTALDRAGAAPAAIDDHAAAALERLDREAGGDAIAVPWYPAAEYAAALDRLPAFAADWGATSHEEYSRELDRRLHDVVAAHGRQPALVPVAVDDLLAFAAETGLDPAWAEARARHADARRGDAIAWPPGRNDPCWCGAGAKYKRHCGA